MHALFTPILTVVILMAATSWPATAAAAEHASGAVMCPGYDAHLRHAQAALQRGARREAIAALRKARVALRSCIREEAKDGSAVADARLQSRGGRAAGRCSASSLDRALDL
jgi:hypothetical protein